MAILNQLKDLNFPKDEDIYQVPLAMRDLAGAVERYGESTGPIGQFRRTLISRFGKEGPEGLSPMELQILFGTPVMQIAAASGIHPFERLRQDISPAAALGSVVSGASEISGAASPSPLSPERALGPQEGLPPGPMARGFDPSITNRLGKPTPSVQREHALALSDLSQMIMQLNMANQELAVLLGQITEQPVSPITYNPSKIKFDLPQAKGKQFEQRKRAYKEALQNQLINTQNAIKVLNHILSHGIPKEYIPSQVLDFLKERIPTTDKELQEDLDAMIKAIETVE